MPVILVATILAIIFLNPVMPLVLKQALYALGLNIKDIIVLLLPFIIFGLLFKAAIMLSNTASKIIVMILIMVCASNFLSTFLSHYVGVWVYSFDLSMIAPKDAQSMEPLWSFSLPKLIANNTAMFAGIIMGIVTSKIYPQKAVIIANKLEQIVGKLLQFIVYLIPAFVVGFLVKLQEDGVITVIIKDYMSIFIAVAIAQYTYIAFAYFFLNNAKVADFLASIKNIIPAAITGFSTMSSAASMPLTIIGAENNANNKEVARFVIPATVNIHLVGDCFAIPIFAYAVLKSFGMSEPSLMNYMIFTLYFVLAKFSVAAIPGGGIIVMLPILERYLGFNAEMMSLITALYILFDPVITCANVLGNGAFAKMVDKSLLIFNRKKEEAVVS
jgi:Na+/H+-dicarboxylate symporter